MLSSPGHRCIARTAHFSCVPYNIEYCSNIASLLLFHFHHFREYSLKVNKHVCNLEAILLDTYDFRFSIAFVKSYISAIHGRNTTAIFVQDLATREILEMYN